MNKTRQEKLKEQGKCPICAKIFKSDDCPHSVSQVEDEVAYSKLFKRLVKDLKREGFHYGAPF